MNGVGDWRSPEPEHTIDVCHEYIVAIDCGSPYRSRLADLGFGGAAISSMGLPGLAKIINLGGGLYTPNDEAGELAVILPVWDEHVPADLTVFFNDPSRIIDLVAWSPRVPETLLTRRGIAASLGERAIRDAFVDLAPLRLFRTPSSWAKAGAESAGAVIIDWRADDLRLLDLQAIVAEDIDHGRDIRAALQRLRRRRALGMPQIRVPCP